MTRYIDAEKLINRMKQDPLFPLVDRYGVLGVIEAEPTADVVEVKHGKWVEKPQADGLNGCSICGIMRFGESNYCPNCGAKMDGGSDEQEERVHH